MGYTFVFTKTAKKDIDKLDNSVKKRLKKKLEFFAACDDIATYAEKLRNIKSGGYRIRVGDYRVIFDLAGRVATVLRVQHRRDVYRNL